MFLYDPKEVETKPEVKNNPYSLASFIAWLEQQPPAAIYNWHNCGGGCLIGQYMAFQGFSWFGGGTPYSDFVDTAHAESGFDWQVIAMRTPWTFGEALKRARKMESGNVSI